MYAFGWQIMITCRDISLLKKRKKEFFRHMSARDFRTEKFMGIIQCKLEIRRRIFHDTCYYNAKWCFIDHKNPGSKAIEMHHFSPPRLFDEISFVAYFINGHLFLRFPDFSKASSNSERQFHLQHKVIVVNHKHGAQFYFGNEIVVLVGLSCPHVSPIRWKVVAHNKTYFKGTSLNFTNSVHSHQIHQGALYVCTV